MRGMTPSTDWKEDVAADEEARFASYGARMAALQKGRDAKYGDKGRALHRKQLLGAKATFEVLGGLPAHAAHGLFAKPATYDAVIRCSNASMDHAKDRAPDIRGYAFKVKGVTGTSGFGTPAATQEFALINREVFGEPKSAAFIDMVEALADGPLSLIAHMVKTRGLVGGLKKVAALAASTKAPFAGFANESFFSAAPIACGPYACRVKLLPATTTTNANAADSWGKDFGDRLKRGPLTHELQLQFFVDEKTTPIEDASVNWPTPYVTVAKLTLLQQDIFGDDGKRVAQEIEGTTLDPWNCLVEHRPLGDVMRSRKAIYFASEQARGAVFSDAPPS